MKRFDLGMSLNYCGTWGIVEAVREFFQNAYDAQIVDPKNEMYFNYDEKNLVLRIGNKNGLLTTKTLLLGQSSKTNDVKTIGKHGEGYKIATVVLMRNGKSVKVYNRGSKEIWTAKIIKSRRYQADVVVFDIEEQSVFKSIPNHDLIFEVTGITKSEYQSIVDSNLHLQTLKKNYIIQAGNSRILTDRAHAGKLYVGGLYVTTSKYAKFGYDFEPSLIQLDRDRSLIDGLDLQFICGKVICTTKNINIIRKFKDIWDGKYIRGYLDDYFPGSDLDKLYDEMYSSFLAKYGADAVPCTTTEEFNRLKANNFNAVLVSNNDYFYYSSSPNYTKVEEKMLSDSDLADSLRDWFDKYIEEGTDAYKDGSAIVDVIVSRLKG